MMDINEAVHEGVDWLRYDVLVLGAPVFYGTYDKSVLDFIAANKDRLDSAPNSFFNVSVVARTPGKGDGRGQPLHAEVPAALAMEAQGSEGHRREGRLPVLGLATTRS
jgi:hypothetical protein